jgi:hypothetical protein
LPCFNTDAYYTMTKPIATDTPVKTGRYNVVMNALHEYYYFRTHTLGSWDHSLRDHYELSADDSAYCSEFYATSAKPFLIDMNACEYSSSKPWCDPDETSDGEYYIPSMRIWFADHSTVIDAPDESQLIASKPGDWLGLGPTDDEPYGHHTQMLLAYNATDHIYWFVEGNGTDSTSPYGSRKHTVNVGWTSVARDPNIGVCAPSCDSSPWVQTIGRLDDPRVLDP